MNNLFKSAFTDRIWERGQEYVRKGKVKNVVTYGDTTSAKVEGTYTYRVEMTIRKGRITQMNCNCPYAEDGHRCKHMAALAITLSGKEKNKNITNFFDQYEWMLKGKISFFEIHDMLNEACDYFHSLNHSKRIIEESFHALEFMNQLNYRRVRDYMNLLEIIFKKLNAVKKTNEWTKENTQKLMNIFVVTENTVVFNNIETFIFSMFEKSNLHTYVSLIPQFKLFELQGEYIKNLIAIMRKQKIKEEEMIQWVGKYSLKEDDLCYFLSYFEKNELNDEYHLFLINQLHTNQYHYGCLDIIITQLEKISKKQKDKKGYLEVVDYSIKNSDYRTQRYLNSLQRLYKEQEWLDEKNNLFVHWEKELTANDYLFVLNHFKEIPLLVEYFLQHSNFGQYYHSFKIIFDWNKEIALQIFKNLYLEFLGNTESTYDFYHKLRYFQLFNDLENEIKIKDEMIYEIRKHLKNKPAFLREIDDLERELEDRYENM